MFRILLAFGGVFLATTVASAQSVLAPFATSGVPVGRPALTSIGQNVPTVGTKPGQAIGYVGQDGKPITMERPPGQVVDLKNLAAPLSAPLSPELAATQPKSAVDRMFDVWRSALGLNKPTTPGAVNNYTPGLSRRNRERRQMAWWRD